MLIPTDEIIFTQKHTGAVLIKRRNQKASDYINIDKSHNKFN